MTTEEIQDRLERGYTMAIYGTRENIHEQMTNDIKTLLEAINYTHCCESDSEPLVCGCGKNKPVTREPAYIHCDWCDRTYIETN
jgi:hypothetical protein